MTTTLTTEELQAKQFIEEQFIPTLDAIFFEKNPLEYLRWNQNSCRQSAVFGVHFLKELLPQYKWYAWDGDFKDYIRVDGHWTEVEYNHAWIYGIDHKNKRKLLVDPSRNKKERLFMVVEENEYPVWHPDYMFMEKLRSYKMDIRKRMKEIEYYTAMKSTDLLALIKERIEQK